MTTLELIQPREYFKSRVDEAVASLNFSLDDQIEFYLVNLLCDFIQPAALGPQDNPTRILEQPLALILKKALECGPETQVKILKQLGDTSLYVAGYFQDFFNSKSFDVDYYISMGSVAYNKVSGIIRQRHGDEHFTTMYAELAHEFANLVEVLAAIADRNPATGDADLLSTYERWARTNSDRLRRILEENGIHPIRPGTPKEDS